MSPVLATWWAALAAAGAAWVGWPGPALGPAAQTGRPRRWHLRRGLLSVGAGLGALLWHPAAGVGIAALAWWWLGRSPQRPPRSGDTTDLSHLVTLMVGPLRAGAAPATALDQVTRALPGPTAQRLAEPLALLAVGIDAETVWRRMAADPVVGDLGRALVRAQRSGAAVGPTVERLSAELAERAAVSMEDRARAVGVQAAVPLGLCLLPAFLLLGVVPLAVGLFSTVLR